MKDYGIETYGQAIADTYDEHHAALDPAAAVATLASLANGGRALELGIGTGRIALPLAATGIDVSGIDASAPMVACMRQKPGGDAIRVVMGDFAEVAIEGPFDLIVVAFNTFFVLPDQDTQVRCFRNVASRLKPGGSFVIEAFVPDPTRFDKGQTFRAMDVEAKRVTLEATKHDRNAQRLDTQIMTVTDTGIRLHPVQLRYSWPSELDLMAQLAGLRLRERWSTWARQPFLNTSGGHVSVYTN